MMHKTVIISVTLVAIFKSSVHLRTGEYANDVFALFLALTACVYGGAALTPAGQKYGATELLIVILLFLTSVLGVLVSPVRLAAGYVIHGGWDVLHHKHMIGTPIVAWFPPICAIFDFIVGLFVLIRYLN